MLKHFIFFQTPSPWFFFLRLPLTTFSPVENSRVRHLTPKVITLNPSVLPTGSFLDARRRSRVTQMVGQDYILDNSSMIIIHVALVLRRVTHVITDNYIVQYGLDFLFVPVVYAVDDKFCGRKWRFIRINIIDLRDGIFVRSSPNRHSPRFLYRSSKSNCIWTQNVTGFFRSDNTSTHRSIIFRPIVRPTAAGFLVSASKFVFTWGFISRLLYCVDVNEKSIIHNVKYNIILCAQLNASR